MIALSKLLPLVLAAPEGAARHAVPTSFESVPWLVLIPVFPLVGSIINAVFGKRIQTRFGKAANHTIAISAMALAFATAVAAFAKLVALEPESRFLRDYVWNMFTAGMMRVDLAFALDPLSMMMVLIITGIGTLIHIYSTGYMHDEEAYWRFFCYLNLFIFSMLLLVMGDNFAVMFFGWEGVGLCSYLLIGFWYTDIEKAKAAMKAFVVNRFGDFGFIIGLSVLFWGLGGAWHGKTDAEVTYHPNKAFSESLPSADAEHDNHLTRSFDGRMIPLGPTLNFRELKDQVNIEETGVKKWLLGEPERNARATYWGMPLIFVVCVFLFIGACGKSAQIPLYVWLPDAMAGPTPVSALIHAATMVTAGVYMIARLNFLFALSPGAMTVIACTGTLTALFAASIGFFQYDIKKVLAYSTVSQLGFMFIGVGVGAYWAGVYHLLTHAFFKACLFLGSGSVILGCHHEQDMRKMGGLGKYMPTTARTYLYACIAISGFPIANGFFSKDVILGSAYAAGNNLLIPGWILWLVGWIAAAGTSYYMWRSYYMTFSGEYRGAQGHVAEAGHATALHSGDAKAAAHAAQADPAHADAHGSRGADSPPAAHIPAEPEEHGHHGGLPHESPASMTWVLVTLAIGIGLTVLLGIDDFIHVVTGGGFLESLSLEKWLDPVLIASPLVASRREEVPKVVELGLMFASVAVAFGGWLTARTLYKDNANEQRLLALKERYKGLWTVVFNKYYVDEAYAATVIEGSLHTSRLLYWFDQQVLDRLVLFVASAVKFIGFIDGAIDKYVVDGMVNAFANGVISTGQGIRKFETGQIEFYLYTAFAGALLFVGINYVIR